MGRKIGFLSFLRVMNTNVGIFNKLKEMDLLSNLYKQLFLLAAPRGPGHGPTTSSLIISVNGTVIHHHHPSDNNMLLGREINVLDIQFLNKK